MTREDFEKSNSPFNTYDVFGYLIPGASFLFICLMFDVWLKGNAGNGAHIHTPFYTAAKTLLKSQVLENVTLSIVYLLMGAVVIYVAGHIIASISAFSIDRLLTGKGYYYPFVTLTSEKEELSTKGRKDRVRGGFTLFNAFIVLTIILLFLLGITPLSASITYYAAISLGVVLLIGLIVSFFYMTGRKDDEVNKFVFLFSRLYNYSSERISYFTGTQKKLPDDIIEKFKNFTNSEFGTRDLKDSDVYWLSYMYATSRSKLIYDHLVNWLHLYSYARNFSTTLYMSSIYVLLIISVNKIEGIQIDWISYLIFPILFCSSFIMLTRYHYMYISYYSKFLIRSCVFLSKKSEIGVQRTSSLH